MINNFTGFFLVATTTEVGGHHNLSSAIQVWSRDVVLRVSALGVLIAVTLVGNICLILVIMCCASLRHKRVSIFLLNLAGADLMVCCFTMTSEILFVAFGEWVLGHVACKVIVYIQIVTLASTTFILTAMSIDRYQVGDDDDNESDDNDDGDDGGNGDVTMMISSYIFDVVSLKTCLDLMVMTSSSFMAVVRIINVINVITLLL